MHFEVDRTDFHKTRMVEGERPPIADGQIRLAVERFAFTANNISYALAGDMLDYWGFFPAEAPYGRIPAMGLGVVSESANADIPEGGKYFGFYPMATELVATAERTSDGFRDVSPHRAAHAPAYVSFADVSTEPSFREERADEYLLLRGLFMTSFLVEDMLEDNARFGADQVLVTSASSKTSIALAHCLRARGTRSIGITSSTNVDFVEGLGLYDEVVTYDALASLDPMIPSVVVDMAGNATVLRTIHEHFGDRLKYSCQVGATHWDQTAGAPDPLPGPTPEFFFAPSQMVKRSNDWGAGELARRIGGALGEFLDDAPRWLAVRHSAGPDAVSQIYTETLEGRTAPEIGHILSLSADAFADRAAG